MTKRHRASYKGSKNKIGDFIVDNLPKGGFFINLFAGGGAVTHKALSLLGRQYDINHKRECKYKR